MEDRVHPTEKNRVSPMPHENSIQQPPSALALTGDIATSAIVPGTACRVAGVGCSVCWGLPCAGDKCQATKGLADVSLLDILSDVSLLDILSSVARDLPVLLAVTAVALLGILPAVARDIVKDIFDGIVSRLRRLLG